MFSKIRTTTSLLGSVHIASLPSRTVRKISRSREESIFTQIFNTNLNNSHFIISSSSSVNNKYHRPLNSARKLANMAQQDGPAAASPITPTLTHAKMTPRHSSERGHADHGWLNTYHTFSFASYFDPSHMQFGSIRVLNEDRVAPGTGFPTHPHRDAEIFSYIVSGELTHRDSMIARGHEDSQGASSDQFYRMRRGDVQFTTGGSGIAHSEQNEHGKDWVHFLQIWALPWKKGLTPRYHTRSFDERRKREGVLPILSPLKAGLGASEEQEKEAKPALDGTIPIHADLVFAAAIVPPGEKRSYAVGGKDFGGDVVKKAAGRRVYVHLIMTGGSSGDARVKIDGKEELKEGDGCYLDGLKLGDVLNLENTGPKDAELVLLDSD